jgi:hypothetical protein
MGITIHYSGKIKDRTRIDNLVEELADISKTMKWKYDTYSMEQAKDFEGIIVQMPHCDSLQFLFDKNGVLINPLFLEEYIDFGKNEEYVFLLFCKTQFGGVESHEFLVKLLKYLIKKYNLELNIVDETDFWFHGDEKILTDKFNQMTGVINGLRNAFDGEENEYSHLIDKIMKEMDDYKKP